MWNTVSSHVGGYMKIHLTLLLSICIFLFTNHQQCFAEESGKWHFGCYNIFDNAYHFNIEKLETKTATPVICSRYCRLAGYPFTGVLKGTICCCIQDVTDLSKVDEGACHLRCLDGNYDLPCGGLRVFSVYKTDAPYITNVIVQASSITAMANQDFQVEVVVKMGSGLQRWTDFKPEYGLFRNVNVSVAYPNSSPRRYTMTVANAEARLTVKYTFTKMGSRNIQVNASNILSSDSGLLKIIVLSERPQDLQVRFALNYSLQPSCTSKTVASSVFKSYVAVMKGNRVKLRATIQHGINVTFNWNFCFRERRSSSPHLQKASSCATTPERCTVDEQVITFNHSGVCFVVVEASNHLGRATDTLYLVIMTPTIKNVQVQTVSCAETCPSPPIPDWQRTPSRTVYLSNSVSTQSSPEPEPSPVISNAVYRTGSKVCFRATVEVNLRKSVHAEIRFGDDRSMSIDLSQQTSLNWERHLDFNNRAAPQDIENEVLPQESLWRSAPLQLGSNKPSTNCTMCYTDHCTLSIYFSHVYRKSGFYTVDVQISNSSYQTASRLDQAVRVIGDKKSTDTLICDNLVRTGDRTTMEVRGANGVVFLWIIDIRDDPYNPNDPQEIRTSARWKRVYKKPRSSPLGFSFNQPGMYFVRVIESGRYDVEQEFCLIFVEEELGDVILVTQPSDPHVRVGQQVELNVRVGKGSNFTIFWLLNGAKNGTALRELAPYNESQIFVPSQLGCHKIRVSVQNSVSRIEQEANICCEEPLTGLKLDTPKHLNIGDRAEITVSLKSGSHFQINMEISCFIGSGFQSFQNKTGTYSGPSIFRFMTKAFQSGGIFRVFVRVRNHVTKKGRNLVAMNRVTVGTMINQLKVVRSENTYSSAINSGVGNTLIAVINDVFPTKSKDVLYKWMFHIGTDDPHLMIETASALVTIFPSCPGNVNCSVTVEAKSTISTAQLVLPLRLVMVKPPFKLLQLPDVVALAADVAIKTNCPLDAGRKCLVFFSDDNSSLPVVGGASHVQHVFRSPGLWKALLLAQGTENTLFSTYVTVQELIGNIKIKGDTVLYLDATPVGEWKAKVKHGSHLIFGWSIRRKNAPTLNFSESKVSCQREFGHHFNQSGKYELWLEVRNDISSANVSLTVNVRQAITQFRVKSELAYLGNFSVFYLCVNLSRAFELHVRWSDDGWSQTFDQKQLTLVNASMSESKWAKYVLKRRYKNSGTHKVVFTFRWLSDALVTREIVHFVTVYDVTTTPPYSLEIRRKSDNGYVSKPYRVGIGEEVFVELKANQLTTALSCVISWNQDTLTNFSTAILNHERKKTFVVPFHVSKPGQYKCEISSKPAKLVTVVTISAFYDINTVIVSQPYVKTSGIQLKSVRKCELKPTTKGRFKCNAVTFKAQSDGHDVAFIFHVNNTLDQSASGEKVLYVNSTQTAGMGPLAVSNQATLEYTFTNEGAYNVTVTAYAVDDRDKTHEVASRSNSLPYLFYAQSKPNVSFASNSSFVFEVGKVALMRLIGAKHGQQLTVNWTMGDGKVYNNAGLTMNKHKYTRSGDHWLRVIVFNKIGGEILRKKVVAERKLVSAVVQTQFNQSTMLARQFAAFTVKVVPCNAGSRYYKWSFTDASNVTKQRPVYYRNYTEYRFAKAGRYNVSCIVSNQLSSVTSEPLEVTLIDDVYHVMVDGPPSCKVGRKVTFTSSVSQGAAHEWIMGDGKIFRNTSVVLHAFKRTGIFLVNYTYWNELQTLRFQKQVFVMRQNCPIPTVVMTAMPKRVLRSYPLNLEASVAFNCSHVERIDYQWTVRKRTDSVNYSGALFSGTEHFFNLPSGALEYGVYQVTVNTTLVGTVLFATAQVDFLVEASPLVALIDGGTTMTTSRDTTIELDASHSYDPDFPKDSQLRYSWKCFVLHEPEKSCFMPLPTTAPSSFSTSTKSDEASVRSYNRGWSYFEPQTFATSAAPLSYIDFNEPVYLLKTENLNRDFSTFVFQVDVSKPQRQTVTATAVVKIVDENEVVHVNIHCPTCTKSSVNLQAETLLFAECSNCDGGHVRFDWTISLVDDGSEPNSNALSNCVEPSVENIYGWSSNSTSNESITQFDIDQAFMNQSSLDGPKPQHYDENFHGQLPTSKDKFDPKENESNDLSVSSFIWEEVGDTGIPNDPGGFEFLDLAEFGATPSAGALPPNPNSYTMFEIYESSGTRDQPTSREAGPFEGLAGGRVFATHENRTHEAYRRQQTHANSPVWLPLFGNMSGLDLVNQLRNQNRNAHLVTPLDLEEDRLVNEDKIAGLPPNVHFQDFIQQKLKLDQFSRIPDVNDNRSLSGQMLLLLSNKLAQGRTYAVKAEATHYTGNNNVIKHGSRTFYLRANRGPSMGRCSVVKEGNQQFRFHCMQWKNIQNKLIDTVVTQQSMLNYDIRYSLGKDGETRPIYFGSHYERSFTLPVLKNKVFVHVSLVNNLGAITKVCVIPMNFTSSANASSREGFFSVLNSTYEQTVGKRSKLQLLIAEGDDNAILSFVNMILDSMPSVSGVKNMTKKHNFVGKQIQIITKGLVEALAKYKCCARLRATHDLIETLSRVLTYNEFMLNTTLTQTSDILARTLVVSRQMATGARKQKIRRKYLEESVIKELSALGGEMEILKEAEGIVKHSLCALNAILSSRHPATRFELRSRRSIKDSPNHIGLIERDLRDFYFDVVKYRSLYFGSCTITADGIQILVQRAKSSLIIEKDSFPRAEVQFPSSSLNLYSGKNVTTLFQSSIAFMNKNLFHQAKNLIQMDSSALSLWMMNERTSVVNVSHLTEPITIRLPKRPISQTNNSVDGSYTVAQDRLSQHEFKFNDVENMTLHILLSVDNSFNRPFEIAVALTDHPLSTEDPLNDTVIIKLATIPKQSSRSVLKSGTTQSVKFMLSPGYLLGPGLFYVTLFDHKIGKTYFRHRSLAPNIPYTLKIWNSDCFYWQSEANTWSTAGCEVLNESRFEQTVCSVTHLSTFTSSFQRLKTTFISKEAFLVAKASALTPTLVVLVFVICSFCCFFCIHRFLLRRSGSFPEVDDVTGEPKAVGLGSWMRRTFGADDRGASGRVPIIHKDNKPDHNQIFEITFHTGNWPGSGTSSLVHMVIYGSEKKYEARELRVPSDYDMESMTVTQNGTFVFETGSIKTFIVTFPENFGSPRKMSIWHSHTGPCPRWFLDYVIIRDVTNGNRWFFPCDSWLALDRGASRISRNLWPMECKPSFVRQMAIRGKNMILDYHSTISIFACARWGILSRAQRIAHAMTLCIVVMALASVKTIMTESNEYGYGVSCFTGENVAWGFIIAVCATVFLIPAQLIFRYTKRDDRISVVMEDSTSNSTHSPFANFYGDLPMNKSGNDQYNDTPPGNLRKTATVMHNFIELDDIINETPNKFVTEWLQCKEMDVETENGTFNKPGHHEISTFLPGSVISLKSDGSLYNEEIARCMGTPFSGSTDSTNVTHTRSPDHRYDSLQVLSDRSSPPNSNLQTNKSFVSFSEPEREEIQKQDGASFNSANNEYVDELVDNPSFFAMDGPELVPCEKLNPIVPINTAPLPRQCSYIAWAYYMIIAMISVMCTVYGATKYLIDSDFDRWLETACFAIFWSAVVVEILFVLCSALIATMRNVVMRQDATQTLEQLFPTVDAAPVDDYAYKHRDHYSLFGQHEEDEISSSEITKRLSERRRMRYLRNIAPPYNDKGKWKIKQNPLQKLSKKLRRYAAAKCALFSWLQLLYLALTLAVITATQNAWSKEASQHRAHFRQLFESGVCIAGKNFLSTNCSKNSSVSGFSDIRTLRNWRVWCKRFLMSNENERQFENVSSRIQRSENTLLLGTVQITNLHKRVEDKCSTHSARMIKILNLTECSIGNVSLGDSFTNKQSGKVYQVKKKYEFNLFQPDKFNNDNLFTTEPDAIRMQLLTYNTVTKHYTTVVGVLEFRYGTEQPRSWLQFRSVNLTAGDNNQRNMLAFCQVLLVIWVAWSSVRYVVSLIERNASSPENHKELRERLVLPSNFFMSILDLLMWSVVVCYLVASTVLRSSLLRSADYFTSNGHLGSDYPEYLDAIITNETISRHFMAAWTVLLVIQCINFVVTWHGSNSKFTRGMAVMFGSVKSEATVIYLVFVVLLFMLAALGYLFFGSNMFYRSSMARSFQETTRWSLGLRSTFISNTNSAGSRVGAALCIFYFCFVFFAMRVIMRALLVKVYQRQISTSKTTDNGNSNKKYKSYLQHGSSLAWQISKGGSLSSEPWRNAKDQFQHDLGQQISFIDMWRAVKQEMHKLFKLILPSVFCGRIPGFLMKRSSDTVSTGDQQSTSRESLRTISDRKSFKHSSLEKRKMGFDSGISSTGTTSGFIEDGFGVPNLRKEEMLYAKTYDDFELTGDVALSEAELQVQELCIRASYLIDEEMDHLNDQTDDHESIVKSISKTMSAVEGNAKLEKISKRLSVFVQRHTERDYDEETVYSESTFDRGLNSSWNFSDDLRYDTAQSLSASRHHLGSETVLYSETQNMSLSSNCEFSRENILKSRTQKSPVIEDNKNVCEKSNVGQSYLKEQKAREAAWSAVDTVVGPETEQPLPTISGDDLRKVQQATGLTALNLARHNHHIVSKLCDQENQLARNDAGILLESISSDSSESKSSIQDNKKKPTLWRTLLKSKHRKKKTSISPVKSRPLRRSQTIFVNATKLPVSQFLAARSKLNLDGEKSACSEQSRTPRFSYAFGVKQPQGSTTLISSSDSSRQTRRTKDVHSDFCEEERNLPGFIPEENSISQQPSVIKKYRY